MKFYKILKQSFSACVVVSSFSSPVNAQLSEQYECRYQATGTFNRVYGSLSPGDQVEVDWNFIVDGVDGRIPAQNNQLFVQSGSINILHESQGSLSYEIREIRVFDTDRSDSIIMLYSNPKGQLGTTDPGIVTNNFPTLVFVNGVEASGRADLVIGNDYPMDVSALNEFSFGTTIPAVAVTRVRDTDGQTLPGHAISLGTISGVCEKIPVQILNIDSVPQRWPNYLNFAGGSARFKVAIPGSAESGDIRSRLDKTSLTLEGIPALAVRRRVNDITSPSTLENGVPICQPGVPDGHADLVAVWNKADLIAVFQDAQDGEIKEITLEGRLDDGSLVIGKDFIVIDRAQ